MGQNDILLNRRVVTTTSAGLATKIENPSTGVYYIGKAAVGTLGSAASWSICKLDTNTLALNKTWADGTDASTKIWDNRAGYTYS